MESNISNDTTKNYLAPWAVGKIERNYILN
jgi:hypothetical protein